MKKPVVNFLWIREKKPDRFSSLIMWYLNKPYSHCAIHYQKTGMIWHATTPGGVLEEPPAVAMKGCTISAILRDVELNCTEERFEGFLEGERGKGYAHRGNIAVIAESIPLVGKFIADYFYGRRDMNQERNCSEFAGNIWHMFKSPLPGRKDRWKPDFLEKHLKPHRY